MTTVTAGFSGILTTLHNGRTIARNRRAAYQAEIHASRVAEDEEQAVIMLIEALRAAKADAAREKARADALAKEVARLRLERLRSR